MSERIGLNRGHGLRGGALAVWAALAVAGPTESAGAKTTTFDVPNAHGTFAAAINSTGLIAGD
jgi:hypothetical protein